MNWSYPDEREFWRCKCRDSFYWFFRVAWGYDFNPLGGAGPRKWFRDETHLMACDWFQLHAMEWLESRKTNMAQTKKLAIIVPREWGKSTLFTQAGMLWLLLHDPDLAITIDSESDIKAKILLSSIMSVADGEDKNSAFARLFGSLYNPSRTWKKDMLISGMRTNVARKEPTFGTCSVTKGITMQHPDVWDLDDPTSYEKMREVANWLDVANEHVTAMVPVFGEGTLWLWPGTRYGDSDHFGDTLSREGIASVTGMDLPDFDVTPDGLWHVLYLSGRDSRGEPTMPHIWSKKRMDAFERRNPLRFSAQILNNPFEGTFSPLTRPEAERCYVEDDQAIPWRMMRFTGHMDTAFKSPDRVMKGDFTSFAIWGHMLDGSGKVGLWGQWGSNKWQADDLAVKIINEYQAMKAKGCNLTLLTAEQEPGGWAGTWMAFLQNKFAMAGLTMPQLITLKRAGRAEDKAQRLIDAAAFWKDLKVFLPRGRPGCEELIKQMTRIVGGRLKKDYADASADVFHLEVYRAMRKYYPALDSYQENPFDALLKGNIRATDAHADKIAEQEALEGYYDPV